jgi:hypothetical protein
MLRSASLTRRIALQVSALNQIQTEGLRRGASDRLERVAMLRQSGFENTLHDRRRAPTHVMAPEYDLSIAKVSGPVALRSVSQVDRLSSVAAFLKRL